jgi:ATP-dependent exoDNAse (exonuclease V) alpha subunit
VLRCIKEALAKGARVLFALPTAQLASRMRSKLGTLPNLEIDTCHAAFKLDSEESESFPLMTPYDLVIVDELSLLDQPQFERMLRLWRTADKVPALVFLGDKWQLPGVGATRPWESPAWKIGQIRFVKLIHAWRCKDEAFRRILDALRTSRPTKASRLVQKICLGHKAWKGDRPDKKDVARLFEKHPATTIVTATRKGSSEMNRLAVEALYGRKRPLVILPGDIEANVNNYKDGKLDASGKKLAPADVPIFKGMKLYLTKNVRKSDDYVNGMSCTVEQWYEAERCLRVKTSTGKQLTITPWTDVDHGKVAFYPIRLGYASTIHKAQGDEFKHITIWLDVPNMRAAGYTALSRVSTGKDYLIGGIMTVDHFVPAH